MDHLPAPLNPVRPDPPITYLCREKYDGGAFLSYPDRKGWKAHEISNPVSSKREPSEIASFFQCWLFFGALKEVFRGGISTEDFVKRCDGNKFLTTHKLGGITERWIQKEGELPEATQLRHAKHLHPCLLQIHRVFDAWGASRLQPFEDPWLHTALVTLAEWLGLVFEQAYREVIKRNGSANDESMRALKGWSSGETVITETMREDGWCTSAVRRLSGKLTVGGMYFVSRMERPGPEYIHTKCEIQACVGYNVPDGSYATKHRDSQCKCQHVFPDMEQICAILGRNEVPVVSFRDGKLRVFSSAAEDKNYVAISHVWSDGLGNRNSNSLPCCQLAHLDQLVSQICDADDKKNLFWLDTLCCPLKPKEFKNSALALMRDTYRKANRVIVLDSYVQTQSLKQLSEIEAFMRIHNSQWNRRLWTLEECVLGRYNLRFQFDGNVLDPLREISKGGRYLSDGSVLGLKTAVPPEIFALDDPEVPLRQRIMMLQRVLQDRATTEPADEPICIASVLDLDLRHIVDTKKEDRMTEVWRMVNDVPAQFAFWLKKTLQVPGFRWAPATFLDGLGFPRGDYIEGPPARRDVSKGLLIKHQGWLLECPQGELIRRCFHFTGGIDSYSVLCMNEKGLGEHRMNPWTVVGDPQRSQLAVISRQTMQSGHRIVGDALLVVVERRGEDTFYARRVSYAMIQKIGPDIVLWGHYKGRDILRQIHAEQSAWEMYNGKRVNYLMRSKPSNGEVSWWLD